MKRIKVLVVDDSAIVRQTLADILSSDPQIEVIGTAGDPFAAAQRIQAELPDVITLDVEMPRMDGLTFLKKLMSQHPIPVVMCSSLTESGSETAMKALEFGAIEIINKPRIGAKQFIEESKMVICDVVKAAASSRLRPLSPMRHSSPTAAERMVSPKLSADAVLEKPTSKAMIQTTEKVVIVGASTGGTEALKVFLEEFPANCPGIVIVQHMPENFTAAFARRLDSLCMINVKEAQDNDTVVRGRALIAPGNKHTLLKRSGARYYVEVKDGPLVSRHRPSVDVLFRSAARYAGKNVIGVIMTGMGDDGANGMREMKDAGAYNIAQDEASCVVFGMPNEAIKKGGVDKIMPLDKITREVLRLGNM
ncbi:MAG: chemotaxis response regulator protein-glutamate methylesterase [Candidatus Magnetominusculus sp. LBB02]|nr:chemotaxis response regulator protein-glutamate methylesterase [Candidatus Magnetominusculus sp. LBB02]